MYRTISSVFGVFFVSLLISSDAIANTNSSEYQTPTPEFARLVEVQSTPDILMSPDNDWLVQLSTHSLGKTKQAQPQLNLFGIEFNPYNFSRHDIKRYVEIEIKHVISGSVLNINNLPDGEIRDVKWSANSRYLSFVLEQSNSATLWVFDVQSRRLEQVTQSTLNGFLTKTPYQWLPDSTGFVVNVAVNHGKPLLEKPKVEKVKSIALPSRDGLVVTEHFHPIEVQALQPNANTSTEVDVTPDQPEIAQETMSDETNAEENLEPDPIADQFKFFAQGQLIKINLSGLAKPIGQATFLNHFDVSPDSTNLIVNMIDDPITSTLPMQNFANVWHVWGMTGHALYELLVNPLVESIDTKPVHLKQKFQWRLDKGATVLWAEPKPDGSENLLVVSAPFRKAPQVFATLDWQLEHINWASDSLALLTEKSLDGKKYRQSIITPRDAQQRRVVFKEFNSQLPENVWHKFIMQTNDLGTEVLKVVGGRYLFVLSQQVEGDIVSQVLERFDAKTNSKSTLWRSQAEFSESLVSLLDDEGMRLLLSKETQLQPTNFFVSDLTFNTLEQLTRNTHPIEGFIGVKKEQLQYLRADGKKLTANLYLPNNYDFTQGSLPVLFWLGDDIYNKKGEFVTSNHKDMVAYVTKGIAILENPSMPSIQNVASSNAFMTDFKSSLKAATDALIAKGVAELGKMSIAGHGRGATLASLALANTDYFSSGILRSGQYNASMATKGYLDSDFAYWQNASIFAGVSAFNSIDKIDVPVLIIHGQADETASVLQAELLYKTLFALNKEARLVLLPNEHHQYQSIEAILHVLWEQEQWLERFVLPKPSEYLLN